ncbi:BadF/BadG/BcrA/BcrD ATPase family protein [Pedococcus ginsenosidimutans]|uniref:BadF/BadG/BcrA/BcrD ATPase family protein n=1 Tax=Pedococcus ginsenosidimutans TaxID=490570 RepID=A0ABP8XQN0_9MICO
MSSGGGSCVAAVDIGGSGLRVQVCRDGRPGPVRTAPGVRIQPGGIDVPTLALAARGLLAEEGGPQAPDVVVWSMRGLLFLADRVEVMRTVRSTLGAGRTVVVSDAVANLVGALGGLRPGAVMAAGTGAVAFGTDFGDTWRRVDGWGHVLGDVGSAAWLGLEGLRAALRAHDGLPDGSSVLLRAGVDAHGEPATWPRQVMNAPDAPERLAGFAPAVAGAAPADPVAAALCARAGQGLGDSLLAAAVGLEDPVLAATGGVLGAPVVRAALEERLTAQGRHLTPAVGGALDGARLLGAHLVEAGTLPTHAAYLLVG